MLRSPQSAVPAAVSVHLAPSGPGERPAPATGASVDEPAREGAGVPCVVAPVRPSEPLGAVGLILPTFVQDTVPTWAEAPPATAPDADPLAELADLCRRAEEAGADALWACDHLFWHGPCLECLVVLTVAATVTERAALGTCVVQLPLRRAVAVAKQAATLQTLSRGRLILGVGVGSHPGEYEQVGAAYHRRGHDLDTGIGELHRAWGSGAGADTGRHHVDRRHRALPPAAGAVPGARSGSGAPRRRPCGGPPTWPTAGCRSSCRSTSTATPSSG